MAETDSPLKRLVSAYITDFATWLLRANVRQARSLNVELTAATLTADQVFHVTLDSGQALVLHIEFQGRRSNPPMSWRMLEYMTRLASTHRLPLHSVVLYVGRGAGAEDAGEHMVSGVNDAVVMSWRYHVIRLWQMPAQDLLTLDSPALLALVGQTRIEQPDVVLPEVVTRLRAVSDDESRGRLFSALLALIQEEELVAMVERLLEHDFLLELPYLRRIHEEGRQEGIQEGRQEGIQEGRQEGIQEGIQEGVLATHRRDIMQALSLRFDIQDIADHPIAELLEHITDEALLNTLFVAAIQSTTMAEFQIALDSALSS